MIIKGGARGGPRDLGQYLSQQGKNEWIAALEVRGTVATNVADAIVEMDALAAGTRCEKPLYHAMINPAPPHVLSSDQWREAVEALEKKLGFEGHARAVVIHEKKDRQHIHVVWSRIDLQTMRAVSDSHNFRRHEEVARDLERRFGHDRVQGAHAERDGVERPDRTPSRPELRQEERTGITGREVKAEVSAIFRGSDRAEAFRSALEDAGYVLAQGDRRDFVIVDRAGGVHSLARRIDGVRAADLRTFMAPIDREALPSADQAQAIQLSRHADRGPDRDPDDDHRRGRRSSRGEDTIEAAYAKGYDYVTQSRAAQRDFTRRQNENYRRFLDEDGDRAQQADRARVRAEEHEKSRDEYERLTGPSASSKSGALDNVEITDRMARLLGEFEDRGSSLTQGDDWRPDRQREAPGGGRTRSR